MALLDRIQTGASGILNILERLNGAFQPSMNPVRDPALEALAGPEGAAQAQQQYQRAYQAQRAQALRDGARWWEMDAMAAPGAQDAYTQNLMRSAQAVDMLRQQRAQSGRIEAIQQMIAGISDPQQRALAAASPETFAQEAVKSSFRPETDSFSMTPVGNGALAVLDKRSGEIQIVKDPESAKALEDNVATVQEHNGRLYVIGRSGRLINEIEVGPAAQPDLTPGQKAMDQSFAKEYVDWQATGGFADVEKQIDQLREIQDLLDPAKKKNRRKPITGARVGMTPNAILPISNPLALAARDTVEEVVQRNLRLILGAQFTEREGQRLIARAYNPALSEEENHKRVSRLIKQIEAAAKAKDSAARYFEEHGTLRGWNGKLPSLSDFETDEPGGTGAPLRYVRDPQTGRLVRE